MPVLDSLLLLDNNAALTTTRSSTDWFDTGIVNLDSGAEESPLFLFFQFNTLPLPGTATVTVQIQTSPDQVTWTTQVQSDAVAGSQFTAANPSGRIRLRMPSPGDRFIRANYVVASGPFTAGTITCGFVLERDSVQNYPRNFAV